LVFAKGFFEFIDGEDFVVLNERICLNVLAHLPLQGEGWDGDG
jgi:hypothetical protein